MGSVGPYGVYKGSLWAPWVPMGSIWIPIGSLWISVGVYGIPVGSLWVSMGLCGVYMGYDGVSVGHYGVSVGPCGAPWASASHYGISMGPYGVRTGSLWGPYRCAHPKALSLCHPAAHSAPKRRGGAAGRQLQVPPTAPPSPCATPAL